LRQTSENRIGGVSVSATISA